MRLLDVVALTENLPNLGLYKGQVGTIIEVYEPTVFEVEFVDLNGKTYTDEGYGWSICGQRFWVSSSSPG